MIRGPGLIVILAALALAACEASAAGSPPAAPAAKARAARFAQPAAETIAVPAGPAASTSVLNRALIEGRKTPALDRCMKSGDAAKGYTFPMHDCLTAELDVQDHALNTAYQAVLAASRESDAEAAPGDAYGAGWTARIVEAQKVWVAYRDGKCLTENYPDGQLHRFYGYPSCLIDETIKRTIELEQLTDFVENY